MAQKQSGFTLVEIMVVVAVIALLAMLAIPNLLRAKLTANVSLAQTTLKTISTAAENYAAANNGNYPIEVNQLIDSSPAYLNENYCDGEIRRGYVFTCSFNSDSSGYTIIAQPTDCSLTGDKSFTMSTGGILSEDETCNPAE